MREFNDSKVETINIETKNIEIPDYKMRLGKY
jgi:hypothetical protein